MKGNILDKPCMHDNENMYVYSHGTSCYSYELPHTHVEGEKVLFLSKKWSNFLKIAEQN